MAIVWVLRAVLCPVHLVEISHYLLRQRYAMRLIAMAFFHRYETTISVKTEEK